MSQLVTRIAAHGVATADLWATSAVRGLFLSIASTKKGRILTTLRGLGEVSGYLPGGSLSWGVPGIPKLLQGLLAGGLLGAGVGYGLGYLGDTFLPDTWQRGKLRKLWELWAGRSVQLVVSGGWA